MIEKYNYSLLRHNTFGFDKKASLFVEYESEEEVKSFLKNNKKQPILHIGSGSNLLFVTDFDGTILHSAIKGIEAKEQNNGSVIVRVGAGVVFDDFCCQMAQKNYGGIENLSHIPGEVGASAVQNIGAYGVEVKDLIVEVETINIDTLEKRIFSNSECEYRYRSSIFKTSAKDKYIVLSVLFRLTKNGLPNIAYSALNTQLTDTPTPSIVDVRNAVINIRAEKLPDPKIYGNAGSFFKNPYCSTKHLHKLTSKHPDIPHYPIDSETVKIPAAYLIEQCGFKGKRVGNVGAYKKQPLVLINYGGGEPKEIVNLAQNIMDKVGEVFGISLEPEVIYV